MAVGDGPADIVGRRFGRTPWPAVPDKTVEGSAAFVAGAFAASYVFSNLYSDFWLIFGKL